MNYFELANKIRKAKGPIVAKVFGDDVELTVQVVKRDLIDQMERLGRATGAETDLDIWYDEKLEIWIFDKSYGSV